MVVAVDAMGGDYAPEAVVRGALHAAQCGIAVQLYGKAEIIKEILTFRDGNWRGLPIAIVDCSQTIAMGDEPAKSILIKKDASLVRALKDLQRNQVHSVVTAGNSGAALVGGMLIVKCVTGVLRPALGVVLPTVKGEVFCVDVGANTDCKAEYLKQFAFMGHAYISLYKNMKHPRIGLLSNGTEQYKGSLVAKKAYTLLQKIEAIHFIGNVEPECFFKHKADVFVVDGFVGNVFLKTVQAVIAHVSTFIVGDKEKKSTLELRKNLNSAHTGGALLCGLQQPLIVSHGSSSEDAIYRSICYAQTLVKNDFFNSFKTNVETLLSNDQTWLSRSLNHLLHSRRSS
ncbi:MAG: phosphate acyltransferase PlsX [Candidatus Babeliales bacterium]